MKQVHDCVFCKISSREIPAKIADETENLIAFFDINPAAPTHILIIPKEHISSVNDLKESQGFLMGEMVLLAQKIAKQQNVGDSGFRLVVNTGKEVGQSVFHIHLHLLGGRAMHWPPG